MSQTLSVTKAKARLSELVSAVATTQDHIDITRNGEPVAVLVSHAEITALRETIAVLSDAKTVADIAESLAEIRDGQMTKSEDLRQSLLARVANSA